MLLTHMIDKIRPVRDSPPRQYATHPPLVRTRGGCQMSGGRGGGGGPYWNKKKLLYRELFRFWKFSNI